MPKTDFEDQVERFTTLVYKICGKYVMGFPNKRDDIRGAAMLGMCEGISQARKKKIENVAGCVYINVHREIIDFLLKDRLIQIPRSYIRKMKYLAMEAGELENFKVKDLFPMIFSTAKYEFDDWRIAVDDARWFMVADTMKWLDLSEFEESIVWKRIEGYTYREISEQFDCSAMYPNATIKRIAERWQKKRKNWKYKG